MTEVDPKSAPRAGDSSPSLVTGRTELKFLLPPEQVAAVMRALDGKLPLHHYEGKDAASRLPRARHYTTTVYFDTKSRDLYRAMIRGGSHLKMRAREYYDSFPELTELATSEDQVVRASSVLWIELKTRDGQHSGKRRVGIPRSDLAQFFASGEPTEQMRAIQDATYGQAGSEVLAELLDLRARFSEPLEPNAIVCYRRSAYQNSEGTLRLTFDRELSAYAPKSGLVESDEALVRSSLGKKLGEERRCVVELKSKGNPPDWLVDLLEAHGATASDYSKFKFGSEAVHGAL